MTKYIKHNSNYIKTVRHQFLKDGSTIFERDWVTVGSQLNFGPGKIPYYNDGNFIFTTSPIPYYQKRYKNGVTVATWTYEDVKDATADVNQIKLDEYTEDIRSYVYYGSCLELVRVSIENIINTFPGNITVSDEELGVLKTVEEFVCGGEDVEERYVPIGCDVEATGCEQTYWTLNNPFDINIYLKDVQLTPFDNPLHYLTVSFDKYQVSQDNGSSFSDIETYKVVMRRMYEKVAPPCIETVKNYITTETLNKGESSSISLPIGSYFIEINDEKKNNWETLCYDNGESTVFTIDSSATNIAFDSESGEIKLTLSNGSEQSVDTSSEDQVTISFYKEEKIERVYMYYQMFDDEEYEQTFKAQGWVESCCIMDYWLPDSVFLNRCDEYQRNVLYSEISGIGKNQPVYTVTINGNILIEGYIYNRQVIPLVTIRNLVIQPKEEVIEEYFKNLKGFEKQLLTRKTNPKYTNRFITPIEYNLGFLYYKRTYTWPSNGYCIDIMSPRYIDFVNKLSKTAQLYDELWTDNLWRRMTHEAIKNYDWTYTREFVPGDEQDNVDGGDRMHKVLNVIGRVFDDIKRTIDTIKHNNRVTYNGDRNLPNALLSDKLELRGWDLYSTIPSYDVTEEIDGEEVTKTVSASEDVLTQEFLDTIENLSHDFVWYPTLEPTKLRFADVDIDFMRRLLLSTRRLWETKGTRHGIDMIMGMFGFGNMGEEKCYTITEEYYTTKPREYDEVVGEDETLGERIVRLNKSKGSDFLYDEDASGIPVGSFAIFNKNQQTGKQEPTTYLIPFYNQNKVYDGDFYFQSKGGWFYKGEYTAGSKPNPYKWTETLSYLHVASQVKDLLNVHPNSVQTGDIFYVANINDYIEFTEEPLYSNFFVLEDEFNPENFSSWTNLNLQDGFYDDSPYYSEEEVATYTDYVKKAIYLDSIIPYNRGNNPHVGYGKYDMGNEYLDYMKKPFKYSIDKDDFYTVDDKEEADNIEFELNGPTFSVYNIDEEESDDKKIQIFADNVNETTIDHYCDLKDLKYKEYDLDSIKAKTIQDYYIDSKVIRFKNEIASDEYKRYFRTIIIHYLMQMIPSTAIFVMENFEYSDEKTEPDTRCRVHFLDSDGSTQLYAFKVERGGNVSNPEPGTDWYLRGNDPTNTESFPYGPINQETWFIKYNIPTYTVRFFERETDTQPIDERQIKSGQTVTNSGSWYRKGDSTHTPVVFPYTVDGDVDFVRLVQYTVKWYNNEQDTNPVTRTVMRDERIDSYNPNEIWYRKGDSTRTPVTFPITATKNEDFVRLVQYTFRWYNNEQDTNPHTQTVIHGEQVNSYNPSENWYRKGDSTHAIVTFPITATKNEDFVKLVEYTVKWYENIDDTNPVTNTAIHGEQVNALNPNNSYYRKSDSTHTPVSFPVTITKNEEFVKINNYRVRWYESEEDRNPIEETHIYGTQLTDKGSNWYDKSDSTKTQVQFPYKVTHDVDFVKLVVCTVRFFEDETATQPIRTETVTRGDTVNATGQWYVKGDTNKTIVTFPYTVRNNIDFVKFVPLPEFEVDWVNNNDTIDSPEYYSVAFYDLNGNMIDYKVVTKNTSVNKPDEFDYCRKSDATETMVTFPVTITKNEEFIRMRTIVVTWYDDEV